MTSHEFNVLGLQEQRQHHPRQLFSWELLTAYASLAPPEYNVQTPHACPNLTTQGFLQTDVLAYTIRMRSIMRIDGERTVVTWEAPLATM